MDPRDRLEKGRSAAREGRFEEALAEYVWFHDHALEFSPSLRGVRLSFAFGYCLELGKEYPKAIETLVEIRDRKAENLLDGNSNPALFEDIESINGYLKQAQLTYDLFRQLDEKYPEIAKLCFASARTSIVKSSDFTMARRYIADPEATAARFLLSFNSDIDEIHDGPHREKTLDAFIHIFSERVQVLLAILRGCGETNRADQIQQVALAGISNPEALSAVKAILESGELVDFYATG